MYLGQFPKAHMLICRGWERRLVLEEAGWPAPLRRSVTYGTNGVQPLPHKPVELLAKLEFTQDFLPLFALNSRKTLDLYLTARGEDIKCRPVRDGRVAQLVRARR